MKMSPSRLIAASLSLISLGLILGLMSWRIVSDGLTREATAAMVQRAGSEWQHGRLIEASEHFAAGLWMAVEGGARWQAAQIILMHSDGLLSQSRVREAAQVCFVADRVLGRYDNAWMLDYRCDQMNLQIDIPVELSVMSQYRRTHK